MRPKIVVGCSGGINMTSEPLNSHQCRFAEWSYLAEGAAFPGEVPNITTFISTLPPPPPYFVHVLVYGAATQADLPFALPHGPPERLTDALLQSSHPGHAISLGDVRWAGHNGLLILAPSYPGGGEVGSHLVFSYRRGGTYLGISLHPWPSLFRYRVSGVRHTSKLAPNPAYPQLLNTLKAIVSSTSSADVLRPSAGGS
ncbi:MAG: hypothetical protein WAK93_19525 [Solirubrobacteraceae bacterium]